MKYLTIAIIGLFLIIPILLVTGIQIWLWWSFCERKERGHNCAGQSCTCRKERFKRIFKKGQK